MPEGLTMDALTVGEDAIAFLICCDLPSLDGAVLFALQPRFYDMLPLDLWSAFIGLWHYE